jgi:signal transduction histidine kinase
MDIITNQALLISNLTENQSKILIVDDNSTNLEVLSEALTDYGWEIWVAVDGESALEQIQFAQPDLILLDVMMPGIDGFETCRRLKQCHTTCDIPVIFMTALSDSLNKIKGLNLGAVDYITKPFQKQEVIARVKTHLTISQLNKQLQSQNQLLKQEIKERTAAESALLELNQELENRVAQRTAELLESNQQLQQALQQLQETQTQLVQTEKISSLGQMVAGIAHEVNNPVSCIWGNLHYISQYTQDLIHLVQLFQEHFPDLPIDIEDEIEAIDLDYLIADLPKLVNTVEVATKRIREIMDSLRNYSRVDDSRRLNDLHQGIDSTLMILQHRLKAKPERPAIQVVKSYGNLPEIECYIGQLNQVFMNLIANAIDALDEYYHQKISADVDYQPTIKIQTEILESNWVTICISDNGPGMIEEVKQKLFHQFFTTKPLGKGTGLGLSITRQIVEKHGGELVCHSEPGQGTEFLMKIPVR